MKQKSPQGRRALSFTENIRQLTISLLANIQKISADETHYHAGLQELFNISIKTWESCSAEKQYRMAYDEVRTALSRAIAEYAGHTASSTAQTAVQASAEGSWDTLSQNIQKNILRQAYQRLYYRTTIARAKAYQRLYNLTHKKKKKPKKTQTEKRPARQTCCNSDDLIKASIPQTLKLIRGIINGTIDYTE